MANYQISTSIDAKTSKFRNAFNKAKRIAERFKGTAESVKDTDVDADTSSFRAKMKAARRSMDSFSRMRAKSTLDVNSSAASAQIDRFKAMLKSIPNKHRTRLEVDGNGARRAISAVHKAIGNFKNSLDSLAGDIRTTGTIFSSMFRGVMLSSVTILVPAIASLVPALMAVLNAAAAVGGGAVGMVGAFATAGAGVVGFGAMAMSALKMVEDGTLAVTSEVQNYQSAVESLKSAWQGLIAQNQSEIFNTLANAVNAAKVALAGLSPFLSGVAQGMEVASAATLDWAKNSQVASNFFDMMGSTGVRIFNNMLSAAGNFGSGLIALITNLAPLTEWVSKGFENMGKSFNQWATSVEGSTAIQDFTNFVKTNLPIIGEIFSSTFKGIFNLMKAFAPNSQLIFTSLAQMANRFQQWSATIAASDGFQQFVDYVQTNGPIVLSVIGNIINIIVNLAVGMAPLAAAVLRVVDSFTQWLAKLTESNSVMAMVVGVVATLSGIFMALAPAILFVTQTVIPLIGQFSNFARQSGLLRGVLTALRGAFTLVSTSMLAIIGVVASVVMAIVELWQTNEQFRSNVISIWNNVGTIISAVGTVLMGIFNGIITVLGVLAQAFMPVIAGIAQVVAAVTGWIASFIEANQWILTVISVIGTLIGIFFMVQGAIAIVSGVVSVLSGLFGVLASAAGVVAAALGAISAPVWIVIAVIAALVAIVIVLYKKFEWFRNIVDPVIDSLKRLADIIINGLGKALDWLTDKLGITGDKAKSTGDKIGNSLSLGTQKASTDSIANTTSMQSGVTNNMNLMKSNSMNALTGMNTGVSTNMNSMKNSATTASGGMNNSVTQNFAKMHLSGNTETSSMNSVVTNNLNSMKNGSVTAASGMSNSVTNNMNSMKNGANAATSGMDTETINKFMNMNSGSTSQTDSMNSSVSSAMNSMSSNASSSISGMDSDVSSKFKNMADNAGSAMRHMVSRIESGMAQVKSVMSSGLSGVTSNFTSSMNELQSTTSSAMSSITSTVSSQMSSIRSAFTEGISSISSAWQSGMQNVRSITSSSMSQIRSIASSTMSATVSVFRSGGNQIVSVVTSSMNQSVARMRAAQGQFTSAGSFAMQGFISGMNSQRGAVMATAGSIANAAASKIRSSLDIHSPSRVFKDIGYYTIAGMRVGMEKEGRNVVSETAQLAQRLTNSFNPNLQAKPAVKGINRELNNLSTRGHVTASHTTTVKAEPSTMNLRIQLDTDDEVLTAKVNCVNARDGEVLSF